MIVDLSAWNTMFTDKVQQTFQHRVWFIGVQGSYGRGEATEQSDLDMVVILDKLQMEDIQRYDLMLNTLPHREKMCGFISGKAELLNWEPADLFQFYFDTTPLFGNLDILRGLINPEVVARSIKTGAGNIYHACVHNMLHSKDIEIVKALYKAASFVIQATYYGRTQRYLKHKEELLSAVTKQEAQILETGIAIKTGKLNHNTDIIVLSEQLFIWSKGLLANDCIT